MSFVQATDLLGRPVVDQFGQPVIIRITPVYVTSVAFTGGAVARCWCQNVIPKGQSCSKCHWHNG